MRGSRPSDTGVSCVGISRTSSSLTEQKAAVRPGSSQLLSLAISRPHVLSLATMIKHRSMLDLSLAALKG